MSPARVAALRLVPVADDQLPGTLTSHLVRLERLWRAANNDAERARVERLTIAELASAEAEVAE
jgi:hypothetical protein